ncbi:MAG TPA: sulfatase-like hydrolase/transferase, partial [Phycisphaerae bacterium]|nr:sulfatase-like hydrolase/transferase [Phycisphaerae bacterium]
NPALIGYDQVLKLDDRMAETVASTAAKFLADAPEQPFFLSVGCGQTHRKFPDPGSENDPRYCRPPAPIPDTAATRRDMAGFATLARAMDEGWGTVLAALEAGGLADNTLVICTTDHGIAFPHMKCNLTDHGIGVMLIVRGPGGFGGGKVIDGMVSHIDVFPTLCELLQIDPPAWLEGESMMPLVRGEAEEINEYIFSEVTYHAAYEPMRCIRTKRHKYIQRFHERRRAVMANTDDSPTKDLWLEHGWLDQYAPAEELYDLVFDPNERANLAAEPIMVAEKARLRHWLTQWMQETDDPLLKGPVPVPPGARVSDVDDLSPQDVSRRMQASG